MQKSLYLQEKTFYKKPGFNFPYMHLSSEQNEAPRTLKQT